MRPSDEKYYDVIYIFFFICVYTCSIINGNNTLRTKKKCSDQEFVEERQQHTRGISRNISQLTDMTYLKHTKFHISFVTKDNSLESTLV